MTTTLPTPVGITGKTYSVKKTDSSINNVTVATAAGTIDGAATVIIVSRYNCVSVISDGTNWQII
jgi:hypothetical protein